MSEQALLTVSHLTHEYPGSHGKKAVDDISFAMREGETFGLVGESGCGKTTTGRMLVRLLDITSGSVTFDGQDITKLQGKDLLSYRRQAQIIFQDPYASLDPRKRCGTSLPRASIFTVWPGTGRTGTSRCPG